MKGFKQFATERPILFSSTITTSVLAFYMLAGILAALLTENDASGHIVEAYNIPGFEAEVNALMLAIAFQVPLAILGACLISRIKPRSIIPDTV